MSSFKQVLDECGNSEHQENEQQQTEQAHTAHHPIHSVHVHRATQSNLIASAMIRRHGAHHFGMDRSSLISYGLDQIPAPSASSRASPRVSQPCQRMTGSMASAPTASAHHQPKAACSPTPVSRASER